MKGLESFYNRDALIIVMKSDGFGTITIPAKQQTEDDVFDYSISVVKYPTFPWTQSYKVINEAGIKGAYQIKGLTEHMRYAIAITGKYPRLYFSNDKSIYGLMQWGITAWKTLEYAFSHSSIKLIPNDAPNLSQCTSIEGIFYHISPFEFSMWEWDTSNITNMSRAFMQSWRIDLESVKNWDVSKCTDMSFMFFEAHDALDLGKWDVRNVVDMNRMFTCFNWRVDGLDKWNPESLKNAEYMFFNSGMGIMDERYSKLWKKDISIFLLKDR